MRHGESTARWRGEELDRGAGFVLRAWRKPRHSLALRLRRSLDFSGSYL